MRRLIGVLVLLLSAVSAFAAKEQLNTLMGQLTVEDSFFTSSHDEYFFRVRLNHETIFETNDFDIGFLKASYPNRQAAELVLVGYGPRTHCAGFFRVFDFRGGKVQISEEFGTCNALVDPSEPKLRQYPGITKNPVYVDGTWRIAIVGDEKAPKWFVYKDGHIIEEGKEAQSTGGEEYRYEQKLSMELPDKSKRAQLIEEYGSAKAAYFALLDSRAREAVEQTMEMNPGSKR